MMTTWERGQRAVAVPPRSPSSSSPNSQPQSSSSTNSTVLCCMCGDQGLAEQLFRCKICIFRSQHKYCSDLYPRTKRYGVCNWCLQSRDQELGSVKTPSPDHTNTADHHRQLSRQQNYSSYNYKSASNGDGASTVTLIGRACLLRLNKPIKKKPLRILIRRPTSTAAAAAGSENMMISPGSAMKGNKRRFKTRVRRRYKLLEDV